MIILLYYRKMTTESSTMKVTTDIKKIKASSEIAAIILAEGTPTPFWTLKEYVPFFARVEANLQSLLRDDSAMTEMMDMITILFPGGAFYMQKDVLKKQCKDGIFTTPRGLWQGAKFRFHPKITETGMVQRELRALVWNPEVEPLHGFLGSIVQQAESGRLAEYTTWEIVEEHLSSLPLSNGTQAVIGSVRDAKKKEIEALQVLTPTEAYSLVAVTMLILDMLGEVERQHRHRPLDVFLPTPGEGGGPKKCPKLLGVVGKKEDHVEPAEEKEPPNKRQKQDKVCPTFQQMGSCDQMGCGLLHTRPTKPAAGAPGRCFDFAKGICTRGATCRFSHESTGVRDASKTFFNQPCRSFAKGHCTYAAACRFIHPGGPIASAKLPTVPVVVPDPQPAFMFDYEQMGQSIALANQKLAQATQDRLYLEERRRGGP
jgi:hypothetical protein